MNKKIGVCDSGLGGILVMKALMDANPTVDFMFIGDQQHAPYGALFKYGSMMLREFQKHAIDEVVIACNTLCANVYDELCQAFPTLKLHGVLQPTVNQLVGEQVHSVLVMATAKTVETHAFEKAIHQLDATCQVYEQACPALVPLIEGGAPSHKLDQAAIDYVSAYQGKVDALILGCTHFPLVSEAVKKVLNVKIFNSNQAAVKMMHLPKGDKKGDVLVVTSKDATLLKQQIKRLLNLDLNVQKIDFED